MKNELETITTKYLPMYKLQATLHSTYYILKTVIEQHNIQPNYLTGTTVAFYDLELVKNALKQNRIDKGRFHEVKRFNNI